MSQQGNSFASADVRLYTQLGRYGYTPQTIYDIGASNGGWSIEIEKVFPTATFHMFEPLADKIEIYSRALAERLPAHPHLVSHRIGLGDRNEAQDIAIFRNAVGSSFTNAALFKKGPNEYVSNVVSVPMRRLDDYVAEHNLAQPQIIKMDVQGFEDRVIAGGTETIKKADIVSVEAWLYKGYGAGTALFHEIVEVMEGSGFYMTDLGDPYIGPKHRFMAVDAYFMRSDFLDQIEIQTNQWKWTI